MSAVWGEVLLPGGAVQHVRIPVTRVTVPASTIHPCIRTTLKETARA